MSEAEIEQKGVHTIKASLPGTGRLANLIPLLKQNPLILLGLVVVVLVSGFFGIRYWLDMSSKIFIENSEVNAQVTSLGPDTSGTLREVYVKEGDRVSAGQSLFNVGGKITSSMTPGIITMVQNTPGQFVSSQTVVVKLYDPSGLRVVGHIQEDQGLSDLRVGQKVAFTLDAFTGRQYEGTVDSIATISNDSKVVFSISDKRQEKQFDVKVAFDVNAYPEIKNGMSAKMWVLK
jgi:multidrug resistance efflux pump